MMYKAFQISLMIFLFICFAAQANEKDLAEFNAAYKEYLELVAASEDIESAILAAEKAYKLAPRIYGKKSEEYAVIIFNLAGLYDERGGNIYSKQEKKASDLYEKYFRIQDLRKVAKDKSYLSQYIPYVFAYYQSRPKGARSKVATKMLDIAYSLELSTLELANLEYYAAVLLSDYVRIDYAIPHYEKALSLFEKQFGLNHFKVGELNLILGKIDLSYKRPDKAIEKLLKASNVFETNETDQDVHALKINTYASLAYHYSKVDNLVEAAKYSELIRNLTAQHSTNKSDIVPLKRQPPLYPQKAAKNGITGYVIVEFTIDKNGRTKEIEAVEYSHKMFVRSSIEAVSKYQYKPAEQDEQSQENKKEQVRIDFQLANNNSKIPKFVENQLLLKHYMDQKINRRPIF